MKLRPAATDETGASEGGVESALRREPGDDPLRARILRDDGAAVRE